MIMGFETIAKSQEELWLQYADQFPVRQRLVYLNHAAVSPLCRPAAEAMRWLAADAMEYGSLHYGQWLETYEGLRAAAARLIGAGRSEIALMKNTSEGIATIAMGLDWRAGDKVVAFREEFPANYYPWKRLEGTGVRVEWLSYLDPVDRIDQACRGARLLAISFVQYLSGHRADLEAIGEICHRHGCAFLVDAIQGLGAFPVDVRRAHIDRKSTRLNSSHLVISYAVFCLNKKPRGGQTGADQADDASRGSKPGVEEPGQCQPGLVPQDFLSALAEIGGRAGGDQIARDVD